jgi:hypothetical protein
MLWGQGRDFIKFADLSLPYIFTISLGREERYRTLTFQNEN